MNAVYLIGATLFLMLCEAPPALCVVPLAVGVYWHMLEKQWSRHSTSRETAVDELASAPNEAASAFLAQEPEADSALEPGSARLVALSSPPSKADMAALVAAAQAQATPEFDAGLTPSTASGWAYAPEGVLSAPFVEEFDFQAECLSADSLLDDEPRNNFERDFSAWLAAQRGLLKSS